MSGNVLTDGQPVSPTTLAYLAGFFDGEGCVHIGGSWKAANRASYHRLAINVSQMDPAPLYLFSDLFGGKVHLYNSRAYQWQRASRGALRVLEALLPYLVVKREQARLGILFQQQFLGQRRGAVKRSLFELAERESFANAFSDIRSMAYPRREELAA